MDTGEPAFHDLSELGELCGATAMQTRFAEGLLAGLNQTEAAERAGYAGARDSQQLRGAGAAAARSKPVQALLALAESRGFGVPNAPGDRDELIRILWSHARSKDKQSSIRASVELDRIVREEREARPERDPAEILRELATVSAEVAVTLAAEANMIWRPELSAEQQAALDERRMAAAQDWISKHPDQARAFLATVPVTNGSGRREQLEEAAP
jgi:hypothetical protein